jgi:hypothetical protein
VGLCWGARSMRFAACRSAIPGLSLALDHASVFRAQQYLTRAVHVFACCQASVLADGHLLPGRRVLRRDRTGGALMRPAAAVTVSAGRVGAWSCSTFAGRGGVMRIGSARRRGRDVPGTRRPALATRLAVTSALLSVRAGRILRTTAATTPPEHRTRTVHRNPSPHTVDCSGSRAR